MNKATTYRSDQREWMVEDEVIAQNIADDGGAFLLNFGRNASLQEIYQAINETLRRHGGLWKNVLTIGRISDGRGLHGLSYEVWYYKGAGGD